ncbi:transposase [Leptospira weilii serovar Heyan]|nr:transposase [Leptospira weilii serovar Heyan]
MYKLAIRVSLENWKKKYLTDSGPFQDELRAENERLRKELLEVTEEREILKKSVAIFLKPRK